MVQMSYTVRCSAAPPMGHMQGLVPQPLVKILQQACHLHRLPQRWLPTSGAWRGWWGASHHRCSRGPWIRHCVSQRGGTEQHPEGCLSTKTYQSSHDGYSHLRKARSDIYSLFTGAFNF